MDGETARALYGVRPNSTTDTLDLSAPRSRRAGARALVGTVTVEGVGLAALVGDCRDFIEQVAIGEGGGLQLGVCFAEPEHLHAVAGAAVRAGAVRDLRLLLDPPVRERGVFADDADKLGAALE